MFSLGFKSIRANAKKINNKQTYTEYKNLRSLTIYLLTSMHNDKENFHYKIGRLQLLHKTI